MMIAEYLPYEMQSIDLTITGKFNRYFQNEYFSYFGETYLVTISTYYYSCLDWYSMYAIRYKELVKKDEGKNRPTTVNADRIWLFLHKTGGGEAIFFVLWDTSQKSDIPMSNQL